MLLKLLSMGKNPEKSKTRSEGNSSKDATLEVDDYHIGLKQITLFLKIKLVIII